MPSLIQYLDSIPSQSQIDFLSELYKLKDICLALENFLPVTKEFTNSFLHLLERNKNLYLIRRDERYDNSSSIQHTIVDFVQEFYPVEQWKLFTAYTPFYSDNVEVKEKHQHIINLNLNFCDNMYPSFIFKHYYANIIPQLQEVFSSQHVKEFLKIEDFVFLKDLMQAPRYFSFMITTKEVDFNKDFIVEALHQILHEYDSRDYIPNKIDVDTILYELKRDAIETLQYLSLDRVIQGKEARTRTKKI